MECASMLNKKSSANSYSEESLPSEVCTFPPEKRILKSDEFGRVFKTGNHRIRQDSLQLIALTHQHDISRLGLVVPKKMLKRAVHRNRLKRLLREAFRIWKSPVPCDVVISLKQKIDPQLLYSDSITVSIQQVFQKLDRYSSRPPKRKKG